MTEFEYPLAEEDETRECPKRLELLLDLERWDDQQAILFDSKDTGESWLQVPASILRTTTEMR